MNANEVLEQLKALGNPSTRNVLLKHGAPDNIWGVKVGDMKPMVKKIKKDYHLAKELYNSGYSDAMYFAGLIADEKQMTKKDLSDWVAKADWYMISEYTVPWITAESKHALELGLEWIENDNENIASAGWSTLANYCSIRPDEELDIDLFETLLHRVSNDIHQMQNRVRYTMNGFVISVGSYITDLTDKAQKVASHIGKVEVNMGETACKVPMATTYIQKVIDKGRLGKKRKMARC